MVYGAPGLDIDQICEVAAEAGTPTFLFDRSELKRRASSVQESLAVPGHKTRLLYSVKTNYMPHVLEELCSLGFGADVVSGHELLLATSMGARDSGLALNGPYKTPDEIARTLKHGGIVNIDGSEDLNVLERLDPDRSARVGIRINPEQNASAGHGEEWNERTDSAARVGKFGSTLSDGSASRMLQNVRNAGFTVTGLHFHLGSQIVDPSPFLSAVDKVVAFISSHALESDLTVINFGGGMGVAGLARERGKPLSDHDLPGLEFDMTGLSSGIARALGQAGLGHVEVAFEPGRSVVSSCMRLLTRVVNMKTQNGVRWIVLDGGLNIMPTFSFGERRAVWNASTGTEAPCRTTAVLGGPLCYDGDVLMRDVTLPDSTAIGDIVVIEDCGAYSISRSTNFNRPRAAVVEIMNDRWRTVWERETPEDIFAFARHVDFDVSG